MQPVVFVINLARDPARWQKISATLAQQEFRVVRISAIDARRQRRPIQSMVGKVRYSPAMNRNLTPGESACVLSHIAALKRLLRHGHPYAIVMEDDATMDERFRQFVSNDLEKYLSKCDVVKIEGTDSAPRTSLLLDSTDATSLVLPLVPRQGSAAYAVTRKGAQQLMKKFQSFSDPLDFMLSFYEGHGCTYGEVRPLLVQQEDLVSASASNLEAERRVAYAKPAVRRSLFRAVHEAMVHGVWRRAWRLLVVARYALRFRRLTVSAR